MKSASNSLEDGESNSGSEYIAISDLHVEDNKLYIDLELSRKVRKYFFKDRFVIEYDRDINNDKSILAIPAVSLVAPVAWATGADIIVDSLDEMFFKSVEAIRKLYEDWYPQLISQSKIKISNLVSNKIEKKKTGLLFSAGLDSLASYIRNKAQHPTLITLLKTDDRYRYYEKVENTFKSFARDEQVEIHFIRSDIWDARSTTIDNRSLESDFCIKEWWDEVSHGLITLGICAPLTMSEGIGILRIASAYRADQPIRGHGSHYLVKTKLSWANNDIVYDSTDLSRQGKIRNILKGNRDCYEYLRVCVDPSHYIVEDSEPYPRNCGHCEKCFRTITGLLLEGIDPNKCDFMVNNDILTEIRNTFLNGSLRDHAPRLWKDIQDYSRDQDRNYEDTKVAQEYSVEEFFRWFKNFDLERYNVNTYNFLKREFTFSMAHRGVYPTIKQVIGYLSFKRRQGSARKIRSMTSNK